MLTSQVNCLEETGHHVEAHGVKIFYLVDILSDPFVLSFTSLHLKGLSASAVSSCLHLGPL